MCFPGAPAQQGFGQVLTVFPSASVVSLGQRNIASSRCRFVPLDFKGIPRGQMDFPSLLNRGSHFGRLSLELSPLVVLAQSDSAAGLASGTASAVGLSPLAVLVQSDSAEGLASGTASAVGFSPLAVLVQSDSAVGFASGRTPEAETSKEMGSLSAVSFSLQNFLQKDCFLFESTPEASAFSSGRE